MSKRQQWEYCTVTRNTNAPATYLDEMLNAAGKDGWELVAVCACVTTLIFVFKKPK